MGKLIKQTNTSPDPALRYNIFKYVLKHTITSETPFFWPCPLKPYVLPFLSTSFKIDLERTISNRVWHGLQNWPKRDNLGLNLKINLSPLLSLLFVVLLPPSEEFKYSAALVITHNPGNDVTFSVHGYWYKEGATSLFRWVYQCLP